MTNKFIVVTGGTKGIGRAIVEKFFTSGYDVATCARSEQDLAELDTSLSKRDAPARLFCFKHDLSIKEDVERFAGHLLDLKRPIDILVNNAGVFTPGNLTEETDKAFEDTMHANVFSAYYLTKRLAGGMKKRRAGHVFNMCSVASIQAYPRGGSYAVSKFALLGFSKCLRDELKEHGVRVTAVLPGATLTDSWKNSGLPVDRFVRPEDVAETVFLASRLSPESVVEELIIRPQLGDI